MPAGTQRADAIRFIVCLGVVSLCADAAYEGARSVTGPYLKELGASAAEVGLIAGMGEMLAAGLRWFSGQFADRTRSYWTITIFGYALTALSVPLLAFAGNWQMAAVLVAAERTGKAIRGPARDVLMSGATGVVGHGWGFGLHTALDQTGAVIGPLLMAAAVARTDRLAPAFLLLAIPAALTLAALAAARAASPPADPPAPPEAPRALPRVFWLYVIAAGLLASGFIDFALLAYHFGRASLAAPMAIPLIYAGAMGVNGLTALVLGRLFDRWGVVVLCLGIGVSLLALPFALLGGTALAIAGVACWATGLGAQDAILRSAIAQVVSMERRGRAFGVFNAVYGVCWFAGSATMGALYDCSISGVVWFGVALQLISAAIFFSLRRPLAAVR